MKRWSAGNCSRLCGTRFRRARCTRAGNGDNTKERSAEHGSGQYERSRPENGMISPRTVQDSHQRKAQMRTIFHGTQSPRGLFSQTAQVKRVAAYCRVSTALEKARPEAWRDADGRCSARRSPSTRAGSWWTSTPMRGASGTSAKKRREFQADARRLRGGQDRLHHHQIHLPLRRNTLEMPLVYPPPAKSGRADPV